jgi:hypothetical protein
MNRTGGLAQNHFCNRLCGFCVAFVWVVMPFSVKNGPPTYQLEQ